MSGEVTACGMSVPLPSEEGATFQDFYLKAKARVRPSLSEMSRTHSIAAGSNEVMPCVVGGRRYGARESVEAGGVGVRNAGGSHYSVAKVDACQLLANLTCVNFWQSLRGVGVCARLEPLPPDCLRRWRRCTPPHTPSNPHPTHYTLHPPPYTLHPTPYTLHPPPSTLHPPPTPHTPHPTPHTPHPTLQGSMCCNHAPRAQHECCEQ